MGVFTCTTGYRSGEGAQYLAVTLLVNFKSDTRASFNQYMCIALLLSIKHRIEIFATNIVPIILLLFLNEKFYKMVLWSWCILLCLIVWSIKTCLSADFGGKIRCICDQMIPQSVLYFLSIGAKMRWCHFKVSPGKYEKFSVSSFLNIKLPPLPSLSPCTC